MHKILKPSRYRNYCIDSNQILHNGEDHQVLFVAGLNEHLMNPRWWMAAILQKKWINRHISAKAGPIVTKFGTLTHNGPLPNQPLQI